MNGGTSAYYTWFPGYGGNTVNQYNSTITQRPGYSQNLELGGGLGWKGGGYGGEGGGLPSWLSFLGGELPGYLNDRRGFYQDGRQTYGAPPSENQDEPMSSEEYQAAYRRGEDVPQGDRPGYDPYGEELPGSGAAGERRMAELSQQTTALMRERGTMGSGAGGRGYGGYGGYGYGGRRGSF